MLRRKFPGKAHFIPVLRRLETCQLLRRFLGFEEAEIMDERLDALRLDAAVSRWNSEKWQTFSIRGLWPIMWWFYSGFALMWRPWLLALAGELPTDRDLRHFWKCPFEQAIICSLVVYCGDWWNYFWVPSNENSRQLIFFLQPRCQAFVRNIICTLPNYPCQS